MEVGAHTIIVNYNDSAVSGTPFTCKVYDAAKVGVSHLPRGAIGKSLQFVGKMVLSVLELVVCVSSWVLKILMVMSYAMLSP